MQLAPAPVERPFTGVSLWQAIVSSRDTLPAKLRAIAGFIEAEPADFIRMTSREICARLGTSEPTLIRFCRTMGFNGLADFRIELALALAAQSTASSVHPQSADRRLSNPGGKRRIARAALGLVAGDAALLMDNGTTVEALAELLAGDPTVGEKTVMTSGLSVAQSLLRGGRHKVMLPGGVLRASTGSLVGRLFESSLRGMNFDTLVMGADSVDPEVGLSTYSEDEAHANRAMLDAATRVIVLADHTKFRRSRLHRICGLDRVTILVTDDPPPPGVRAALDTAGVQIVVAEPDG